MDPRNVLSEEYPGDAAWRNFVAMCRGGRQVPQECSAFLAEIPDEEVGIVLAALAESDFRLFGHLQRIIDFDPGSFR